MKTLIYLHCYNVDLLEEFLFHIKPVLNKSTDLHIDFCISTFDENLLKNFDVPFTHRIIENKGLDVLPFINYFYEKLLHTTKYDYIVKLHTKKSNEFLRKLMYIPLLDEIKKSNFNIKTEKYIILNNDYLLVDTNFSSDLLEKINTLNNILGLTLTKGKFFYGTMFLTTISFLKRLFNTNFQNLEPLFEVEKNKDTFAHAFEVLFGLAILEFGGELKTFYCENDFVKLDRTLF
jgi:lipopolysaccharide biosynthesis protein